MRMYFMIPCFVLAGCAGAGGGSSGASIQGEDRSGTYRVAEVRCYSDTTFATLTARAQPDSSSPVSTISITGNTFTAKDLDSTCAANQSGTIVFTASTGIVDIKGITTTTSTGVDCAQTITFQAISGGTITPASLASTTQNNGTKADVHATYVTTGAGSIMLFSVLQVQGSPTDICFLGYLKL